MNHMNRSWWLKAIFLAFVTVLSAVYVYPTVARLDLAKTKFPFKEKINLGLDLQGGLYMVLGIDFNKVFQEIVDRQMTSAQTRLREKQVPIKSIKVVREGFAVDDPRIMIDFDPAQKDAVAALLKDEYWTLRLAGEQEGHFEFGLSREYRGQIRDNTMNQSIEVIRNRIDEFGVSEPVIASQGTDRVVVELPGVSEIERAKDLIGRTAKLEFKIVDDKSMAPDQLQALVAQIEKDKNVSFKEGQKFSDYARAINEGAKGKIPAEAEVSFERFEAPGEAPKYMPYLLTAKAGASGEDLSDAQVSIHPEKNSPVVNFQMSPKGAVAMGKITGDNVNKRMAIVLDNIVHSAPVINDQITSSGMIEIGQGDQDKIMNEAKDLAIVLRAGALPAQLDFLEQRIVGPSLGADSIKNGVRAGIIGSILVFLFVLFYYRKSGAIAVLSLLLNVLFVLAILVGIDATLTLPGIAGVALTVGIAVDSNVVIYERIRDELRIGKGAHAAVDSGFQKAFRTILDANICNAAAATVLLLYGTGPIKGFAVTMLIGIVTTLFTAVFVSKLIFDAWLSKIDTQNARTLSI